MMTHIGFILGKVRAHLSPWTAINHTKHAASVDITTSQSAYGHLSAPQYAAAILEVLTTLDTDLSKYQFSKKIINPSTVAFEFETSSANIHENQQNEFKEDLITAQIAFAQALQKFEIDREKNAITFTGLAELLQRHPTLGLTDIVPGMIQEATDGKVRIASHNFSGPFQGDAQGLKYTLNKMHPNQYQPLYGAYGFSGEESVTRSVQSPYRNAQRKKAIDAGLKDIPQLSAAIKASLG
jgi:hypothetical protein